MVEVQQFPTYMTTPLDLNDVQLRSGRILEKERPSIVILEQDNSEEDYLQPNKRSKRTSLQNQNTEIYSNTPSSLITDLSANYSNVGV